MSKAKFSTTWSDMIKDVRKLVKNRIAWIQEINTQGHYYYGENDSLPNEIIEAINNSGTATACANRLRQFIVADGFKDQYTGLLKANKNQTWDELLSEGIGENETKLDGFALQIFFKNNGMFHSAKSIPITWIRRCSDDTFEINPLMGEYGKRESETFNLREFDPSEDINDRRARVVEETIKNKGKQKGELLYCYRKKLGRNYEFYPVPSFYSGIDDIISDGKISRLELRNIMQGWRTPIVISTGHIDNENSHRDENGDDLGITDLDIFNESITEFLGEDAAPVLHLQGRTPEEMPKVTTIDIKEMVDMTEKGTIRLGEKVCRLFEVPRVLMGFAQAGQLGNVQEVKNMMDLFYITIVNRQNWITSKLNLLKPLMEDSEAIDFEISKLNPLTLIPDSVIARLSDLELKELFEIPKLENEPIPGIPNIEPEQVQAVEVNETMTNLTGRQRQGLKRVVREFNKGDINEKQAIIELTAAYGFTEQQAIDYLDIIIEDDGDNNPS